MFFAAGFETTTAPVASMRSSVEGRVQDVKTRLGLARVYLDQGRLDEAEAAFQSVQWSVIHGNRTFGFLEPCTHEHVAVR